MAQKRPLPRLLCYDIADPGRLTRVHRIVSEWAIPVQYSVYYLYIDATGLERLCHELESVIQTTEDDIRIYPLIEGEPADVQGTQGINPGLILAGVAVPQGLDGQTTDPREGQK